MFAVFGLIALIIIIVWEHSPKTVELSKEEIESLALKTPTGM